jgi:glycine oxidase
MARRSIIIGGGVIGLTIARELARRGRPDICIIDQSTIGGEASWAAAGMLSVQAGSDPVGSIFEFCSRSRDYFPKLADDLFIETGIDIELDRRGAIFAAFDEADLMEVGSRFALHREAGLEVEMLTAAEIRRAEPFISTDVKGGLYFANDWQVDNRKLITALTASCREYGIEIIENEQVLSVNVDDGCVSGLELTDRKIDAEIVIAANGAWASHILVGNVAMPFEVRPIRGEIVAFQTAKRLFEHVIHSRHGYIVPREDGRVLAGASTDDAGFDRSVTEEAKADITAMAFRISPSLANLEPVDHWAGLRPFAADGLPIIGKIGGVAGLFVATAHYRNGILLAPATAAAIGDAVVDGGDPWEFTAFGPDRMRFAGSRRDNI